MSKDIVLAFSGGLDTSFCVPYLKERGWAVHTVFADTGGVDAEERAYIEQRAAARPTRASTRCWCPTAI
jgi:argininosuccinate synthase